MRRLVLSCVVAAGLASAVGCRDVALGLGETPERARRHTNELLTALARRFGPAEHDPDSFVREQGAEAFRRLAAEAMPLSEFLLQELRSRAASAAFTTIQPRRGKSWLRRGPTAPGQPCR